MNTTIDQPEKEFRCNFRPRRQDLVRDLERERVRDNRTSLNNTIEVLLEEAIAARRKREQELR